MSEQTWHTETGPNYQPPGAGPPGLWPGGNYTGEYVRCEPGASQVKGTRYVRVYFNVNKREISTDVYLTDATIGVPGAPGMALQQLTAVGWNRGVNAPECSPPGPIALWMKHEEYKGVNRECWAISTVKAASPIAGNDPLMTRIAEVTASMAPAPVAVKAPPRPAAPPRPSAAPPRPPAPPKPSKAKCETQEAAWAVWQTNPRKLSEDKLAEAFWKVVEEIGGTTDFDNVPAAMWEDIAYAESPF